MLEDPRLREGAWPPPAELLLDDYWYGLESDLYRPVTLYSFAVNHALSDGADPRGFVAANVALHAVNALLVLALARVLGLGRGAALSSERALFSSAVEVVKAHMPLAGGLYRAAKDDGDALRRDVDAIVGHAETAWSILSELPPEVGHTNLLSDLAFYYRLEARFAEGDEQRVWLERAVATYEEGLGNEALLGPERNWRLARGQAEALRTWAADEALERFAEALALAPGPEVPEPYARLLAEAGRDREALLAAIRLITLRPDHPAMWEIVRDVYGRLHPGERTVVELGGRRLFNTDHSAVAADLRAAAGRHYRAALALGPGRGAAEYRELVRSTLGFDPAATAVGDAR